MTNYLMCLCLAVTLASCGSKEEPVQQKEDPKSLVEIKDGVYTEYYPGHQHIKFRGEQDAEQKRQGKWVFYAENGVELSITHYIHGLREGVTIVKYPNGTIHYVGEYSNDKEIGIWKSYDENQKLVEEKDYDKLNAAGQ